VGLAGAESADFTGDVEPLLLAAELQPAAATTATAPLAARPQTL